MTTWLAGMRATADRLNDYPKPISYTAITANSATTASTTEVAIITSGNVTLKNGRAYLFEIRGLIQQASASVTDIVAFHLRRTSVSGTLLRNLGGIPVINRATANRNNIVDISHVGVNTTGADITDVIVATYNWDTGSTATFTFAATAGTPASLVIWDLGVASDFPSAGPLT
ncbi:hypothetical protein [Streptomyces sp. NPDC051572]|uniref:hypothetical protein n=1 Tax=Streptomyces sp. NPDC051572 TaxID=3155802 RepID=UPI00344D5026